MVDKVVVHRMTKKRWKTPLILLIVLLILLACAYWAIEPIERLVYPMKYEASVTALAEEFNFTPSFIFAVIYTESKFDPNATSSAGAKGLMQITDDTYQWACKRTGEEASTPEELYDPDTNIRVGCSVLALLYEQFTETETVLAAYNAGQGRVREWLKNPDYSKDGKTLYHIPYEETGNYVHRVINTQKKYQTLYNIP